MDSIIFLRHGQAENNTKRMLSGRSPGVPLTAKGLEQAQNTARFLNGHKIAHIYSSPIERAHETARIAAEHNNVSLTVDERLTELDMGSFTGSKYDEIMEKHGNVFLKFYQKSRDRLQNTSRMQKRHTGQSTGVCQDIPMKRWPRKVTCLFYPYRMRILMQYAPNFSQKQKKSAL